MKKNVSLLVLCLVSIVAWGANGDMGMGTEPLTDGSVDYPYLIEDVNDFDVFASDSTYWATGVHTKLMSVIDLSSRTYTTALVAPDTKNYPYDYVFDGTPFSGSFNGNGFKFINLSIDGGDYNDFIGLFGKLGSSSEVYDLGLENSDVNGRNYVAPFAGSTSGSVTNCYSDGSTVEALSSVGGLVGENYLGILYDCHSTGTLTGSNFVGGITGYNQSGVISNCHFKNGTVNGNGYVGGLVGYNYRLDNHVQDAILMFCSSSGIVNGGNWTGGLVGDNTRSYIYYCYSCGSTYGGDDIGGLVGENTESVITNCYSTGKVTGPLRIGGLIGKCYGFVGPVITNCYWDMQTSGLTTSDGGTYKTTLQMETLSTFTAAGWDFVGENTNGDNDIWRMCVDEVDYPRLSWEFARSGDFACSDGVDFDDLAALAECWLIAETNNPATFSYACDANGDGLINLEDFAALSQNWQ